MGKYIVQGSKAIGATLTPLHIIGSASIKPRVCGIVLSTSGTPTSDQGVNVQLRRSTADGTGTSVTPTPTDAPQAAATSTAKSNYTVEPTYTAGSQLDFAFNPRATFQWAAYDRDSEIATLVASAAGIGLQIIAVGGGAGNVLADIIFGE